MKISQKQQYEPVAVIGSFMKHAMINDANYCNCLTVEGDKPMILLRNTENKDEFNLRELKEAWQKI